MDNEIAQANVSFLGTIEQPNYQTAERESHQKKDRLDEFTSLKKNLMVSIEEQMKELTAFKKEAKKLTS